MVDRDFEAEMREHAAALTPLNLHERLEKIREVVEARLRAKHAKKAP
jgi:hypothetical protein